MARKSNVQVNIRSAYVRDRVRALAEETGKTVTQVVEEAVRSYRPEPPAAEVLLPGVVRNGRLLVWQGGGARISAKDIERAIAEDRGRGAWADGSD